MRCRGPSSPRNRGRHDRTKNVSALLMSAGLLATIAAANAQQAADPRIADIVRAGKVRIGLHLPQFVKDEKTGEIRGNGTGTVIVPIARALAARMGVEARARRASGAAGAHQVPAGRRLRRRLPRLYRRRAPRTSTTRRRTSWCRSPIWCRRTPDPRHRRCRQARRPHRGRAQPCLDPRARARREARRR